MINAKLSASKYSGALLSVVDRSQILWITVMNGYDLKDLSINATFSTANICCDAYISALNAAINKKNKSSTQFR